MKEDKVFYDKKIAYLDYYERGEKIKNGGFVKWEAKGDSSRVQVHIRGLYATDTLQGEIRILSAGESFAADNLLLNYGTGDYASIWKNDNLAETGIAYKECDGIIVRLSENRVLKGQWRESVKKPVQQETLTDEKSEVLDDGMAVSESNMKSGRETIDFHKDGMPADADSLGETSEILDSGTDMEFKEAASSNTEEEPYSETISQSVEESDEKAAFYSEETEQDKETAFGAEETEQGKEMASGAEETEQGKETASGDAETEPYREAVSADAKAMSKEESSDVFAEAVMEKTEALPLPEQPSETALNSVTKEQVILSGDKWEQLNKQYPRIHPFGDSREYLSITPRDFVILSRKYQNLVQNSFLLHGYYNYGHVILTRLKERNEDCFYLGVPGVYFDREKQAALMFGFEGFEAGCEHISEGGFGYYMKRVEI